MLPALSEAVEYDVRSPAPHVVPMVLAAVVVVHEPGVRLGLELADRGEAPVVEGRSPALLKNRAVEALAHRVVVGGPRLDAHMGQALRRQVGPEALRYVLGTVIAEHGSDPHAEAPVVPQHLADETHGVGAVHRSEHDGHKGSPGEDVDGGEYSHSCGHDDAGHPVLAYDVDTRREGH